MKVLETLEARGLIKQLSHREETKILLENPGCSFYLGIDPTGTSLHIGHLVPLCLSRHLMQAGHRALIVLGGGTARIGDPSGKTEGRSLLELETLDQHITLIESQIRQLFARWGLENFLILNNADWLVGLEYIDFLRTIGRYFSVNRMLSFETYKRRMEKGLTFIEFNYLLLQGYDFYHLYKHFQCSLQIGGDDQWANILSGLELIEKKEHGAAFALTVPLVVRHDGQKMGKTEKGALFIDPQRTSPYDFYQYWRNVADVDVKHLLKLYTFLSLDDIQELTVQEGQALNEAKERLAFEITSLVHGTDEAYKAKWASQALFSDSFVLDESSIPVCKIKQTRLQGRLSVLELLHESGLCSSRNDARRLIEGGGVYIDDERLSDFAWTFPIEMKTCLVRCGKKRYLRLVVED